MAAWLGGGFRALAAAPVSISALGSDASPAGGALLRWQKGGSQILISATRHDDAVWAVLGFAIVKPGPKLVRGRPGLGGKLTIRPGVGSGWKVRAWREAGLDIVLQGDVSDRQLDRLLERMRIVEQGDWKPLIASAS
jgi:hypothetical protein